MKMDRFAKKLATAQKEKPWRFLLGSLLFTLVASLCLIGLVFDSSYEALLPGHFPKVINANKVREATGGTRQLFVAIKGKDSKKRLAFGRKLAPELEALKNVRYADLEFPVDFFKDRALWLLKPEELDKLIGSVKKAIKVSSKQANPFAIRLDEEEDKKEKKAAWSKVEKLVTSLKKQGKVKKHLVSKDNQYTFLVIGPSIKFTHMAKGMKFYEELNRAIQKVDPTKYGVQVRVSGNLEVILEQNVQMKRDLSTASILSLLLGMLLIAFSLRRVGAPFLIGFVLLSGIVWTFGITRLTIGYINIISGFLGAVLVGLGIDFGVHLFTRVRQEQELEGRGIEDAVWHATVSTFPPALISALTTAGTFLAFTVANFRGFSEFGMIACLGILATLTSCFLMLPPLLIVLGRKGALSKKVPSKDSAKSGVFASVGQRLQVLWSIPKSWASSFSQKVSELLVERLKKHRIVIKRQALLTFGAGVGVFMFLGLAVYGAVHVKDIVFRNDFRELRGKSESTEFLYYINKELGIGTNPAVFIADSMKDARVIRDKAVAQMKKGFRGEPSKISKVLSISDLVPKASGHKSKKIAELKKVLHDPLLDDSADADPKKAKQLALARKMSAAKAWDEKQLPIALKRRLMTLDQKKFLVFVWPKKLNDVDERAVAWENEIEHLSSALTSLRVRHLKADETLLLAWIYRMIKKESVPLLMLSFLIVICFLLLDFASIKETVVVVFPLLVGMLSFLAMIHILGVELNMFNIIVIPSVIGIGIDNVIHIYHRYKHDGPGSVGLVMRTTGIAALLASATTAIGFGSSLVSHNVGLQTMGTLAIVGISMTFLAATVFFPCFLLLLERFSQKKPRRRRRRRLSQSVLREDLHSPVMRSMD